MSTAQEIWAKWEPAQHETEYAQKRIKSAQSAKLTPVKIDREDMYGYFQGSHGNYETWLDHCPCVDFHRSKLPCKHMYRLAMELGIFSAAFSSNQNAIPVNGSQRASLDYTVDAIEKLPESAQGLLYYIVRDSTIEKPEYWIERDSDYSALVSSELVTECVRDSSVRKFAFGKYNDLKRELKSRGLEYDKSLKKEPLCQFCEEHYPEEMAKIYPELYPVMVDPYFSRKHIQYYLSRKHELNLIADYQDEYGDAYCPVFEDDEYTAQLIKHGYIIPE